MFWKSILNKQPKNFYITTTLPYVNAIPHVGHALEFVRADIIARYKRLSGHDVFFNTGTDEHGQKLLEAAKKEGADVKQYVDKNSLTFKNLLKSLQIVDAKFIRTTDPDHIKSAQEFWKLVDKNGYIYKGRYQAKYCVGCELEKTDSDLVNGKCPLHPNLEIELIDEENYFFKFSAFSDKILKLFAKNPEIVTPAFRLNEVKQFASTGLKDFSISRLKSKMSWGIPVPGDDDHVMYVWFDALVNYVSTLGWPIDAQNFEKFWTKAEKVQYCGQDNIRQQSVIWQAMLMAAGLPNTDRIIIDGFVTGEGGIKMSKSIGNVIDPIKLIDYYGAESFRLYVVKNIHPWDGSPITYDSYHAAYQADLVNGLGNLTSRLLTMSEKSLTAPVDCSRLKIPKEWSKHLDEYRIDLATELIWQKINDLDKAIAETEPFKLVKTDLKKAQKLLTEYIKELYIVAMMLEPILPETSTKIKSLISANKKPAEPLFPRKEMIV